MEWMILPFKRYADFSGRSRRMEYWMFVVLNVFVMGILASLLLTTGMAAGFMGGQPNIYAALSAFGFLGLAMGVWWLFALIPGIAVTVRRLHDRDMSGWWYLGFVVVSFIPLVGFIAGIAFLVILFLDGTPGPNRFGPDPKGRGMVDVFS